MSLQHSHKKYIMILKFILNYWILTLQVTQASPINIVNWPMLSLDKKNIPVWLGNDPVIGRLICPPVSRLNLAKGKSEGLIFDNVSISQTSTGEVTWTYRVRTGIYWWNGTQVTGAHLKNFIEQNLTQIIENRSSSLWKIPQHSIKSMKLETSITWKHKPIFGPYFLNSAALWRKNITSSQSDNIFEYECAGIYYPHKDVAGLILKPTKGYKAYRQEVYFTDQSNTVDQSEKTEQLTFSMPDTFSIRPEKRPPDRPAKCNNQFQLPFLTSIIWNTKANPINQTKVRQLLTNLTPRGALLRSGSGYAGTLLSSVIPRNHPGYDDKILVRPFSAIRAAEGFKNLGFNRPQGDQDRLNHNQKPFQLTLMSMRPKLGILEKVIADSFMSIGILVHYEKYDPKQLNSARIHGVVTGIHLPWPDMNFLNNFHSKAKPQFPFLSLEQKSLDHLLENYAVSLTENTPDFSILKKLHRELYTLEPMTVILQHHACLDFKKAKTNVAIDVRDPDWFRKVLL